MSVRSQTFLLGFILALAVNVSSQLVRLNQTTASGWLFCDYAGRLGGLAVLAAIPAARAVAFQRQPLRISWWETGLWIAVLVIGYPFFSGWVIHYVNTRIPGTTIGHYIFPQGWLRLFDLTAGLALVACHEEVVFRRCSRAVFSFNSNNGTTMVLLSALLFAAYHWTTGLGNMTAVFFFGIYTMLFLRRTGALWPVIVAHFLVDLRWFA